MSFLNTIQTISTALYSNTPQQVNTGVNPFILPDFAAFLQPLQADGPMAYNQQSKDSREAYEYNSLQKMIDAGVLPPSAISEPQGTTQTGAALFGLVLGGFIIYLLRG